MERWRLTAARMFQVPVAHGLANLSTTVRKSEPNLLVFEVHLHLSAC